MEFDDFYVGPTYLPGMPAMSDMEDMGTMSIGATTTAPTKGTIVRDKVWRKRLGDVGTFRYEYEHNGAGSAGSGDYLFTLAGGASFGTGVEFYTGTSADIPHARYMRGNNTIITEGTNYYEVAIVPYDATRFRLYTWSIGAVVGNFMSSSSFSFGNTALRFAVEFTAPIAGWSGTTAVQPGGRYRWAERYAASATRVTTTPSALGQYRYRINGSDTAPSTLPSAGNGIYHYISSGITQVDVYVGPGKSIAMEGYGSVGRTGTVLLDVWYETTGGTLRGTYCAYDPSLGVVTLLSRNYVAMSTALATISSCYLDLVVADDPVPVALAPAVHVAASSDAGQSISGTSTDLQYEDKQIDTHGAWNGTTFTAPVPGVYLFVVQLGLSANSTNFGLYMYRSGALLLTGAYDAYLGLILNSTFVLRFAAGETCTFRGGAATTRTATANQNWLRITRISD